MCYKTPLSCSQSLAKHSVDWNLAIGFTWLGSKLDFASLGKYWSGCWCTSINTYIRMWCMFTKAHKEVWISGVGNGRWGFCFMAGSSKWLCSGSHWREKETCRGIVGVLGVFILCETLLLKLGLGGVGKATLIFCGENMKWGCRARGCHGAHLPSQCASWCSESYHCL